MEQCANGHDLTPENLYANTRLDGYRCRQCRRDAKKRQRETPEYRVWRQRNYEQNKDRWNEARRSQNRNERDACIQAYGGACACCGETWLDYLCIDHVDGGGREHRSTVSNVYRDLRVRGYPAGYQVLCANCNMAKERSGCNH